MLYVLGYTVSILTGSSSGRYKNFESKLLNLVIDLITRITFGRYPVSSSFLQLFFLLDIYKYLPKHSVFEHHTPVCEKVSSTHVKKKKKNIMALCILCFAVHTSNSKTQFLDSILTIWHRNFLLNFSTSC
jgi:hypothetical protein